MEEIIRNFKTIRNGREMIYPFTTFSCVFMETPADENLRKVYRYLADLIVNGRPDFSGKISASQTKPLIINTSQSHCELVDYAKKADYRGRQNGQHYCTQRYLLENDPHTIAVEIPVWNDNMSGHIDILRVFKNRIQIADFKPKAGMEKKAATQLHNYREMLSERLNIARSYFECVYFDELYSYYLI
jgi:hypothetical protein